jgi:hypothetical protein
MAERGLTVFILEPNSKRPLGGQTEDCNYAVHPGDKHVVIDLDRKPNANGVAAFASLCAENGIDNWMMDLDTLIVRSPSGGYHVYFKTDFACANKHDLPEGIDVRGAVGYVVGPGSRNDAGEWEVEDPSADIAPLPDWLAEFLYEPGRKDPRREEPVCEWNLPENIEQAREWLKYHEPAVEGANGDDYTYWTICSLRDFAISEDQILKLLNEGGAKSWNARCQPVWLLDELSVKIENSFEYASNRPGIKSVIHLKNRHQGARPAGGYSFSAAQMDELYAPKSPLQLVAEGGERVEYEEDDEIPEAPDEDEDGLAALYEEDHEGEQFWYGFEEFKALDRVREYIVKDWLIAHGITGIIAKRGTGKSTIALDIACHVATDREWWGTPVQEGWKVVYLCGEDDEGMILNCRAWAQEHGVSPTSDRFLVGRGILNLSRDDDRLEERVRYIKEWAGESRCLIILDTWQRATAGMRTNADEEMELAVGHAETIAEVLNGPMLICYHPPKDGRMTIRGSGVQEDTTSGIWTLEGENQGVRLEIIRAKGRGVGNYRIFSLTPTPVGGKDFYGDELEGVVVKKISGREDEGTVNHQTVRTESGRAWGEAVFGAMTFHEEQPDAPETVKTKHGSSLKAVVDTILHHWEHRNHDGLSGEFYERFMTRLAQINSLQHMGKNSIRDSLENHLNKPVTLENGQQLTLTAKEGSKTRYFNLKGVE